MTMPGPCLPNRYFCLTSFTVFVASDTENKDEKESGVAIYELID